MSTVEEFRAKMAITKDVELPQSKMMFTIRKITGRDFMKYGGLPLLSLNAVSTASEEKDKITTEKGKMLWDKLSQQERIAQIEANDSLMVLATKNPPLCLPNKNGEPTEPGKLCIDELSDDDYNALLSAVSEFSFSRGQDIKPFRESENSSNP